MHLNYTTQDHLGNGRFLIENGNNVIVYVNIILFKYPLHYFQSLN